MALDDGFCLDGDSIEKLRADHEFLESIVRSAAGRRTVLYPSGGPNNGAPTPYIITELGYGDVNVAVYRTSAIGNVMGKRATGEWTVTGDEIELNPGAMHGVVFTGQLVLVETITGVRRITGGWLKELFRGTVTESIASGGSGLVSLRYEDYADDPQTADVTATNITGRGLEEANEVLVGFVSGSSGEEFVIMTLTE